MSPSRKPSAEQSGGERQFADDVGFFWENAGGTRMAGRVLGALLLADPPEMSSAQLTAFLGVSSGSVSTATRELIRPGLVQRVRVPGERQDYFRATMGAAGMSQFVEARMQLTRYFVDLLRRGEKLAAGKSPSVRRRLADVRELYEFFEDEMAAIVQRWDKRRRAARR